MMYNCLKLHKLNFELDSIKIMGVTLLQSPFLQVKIWILGPGFQSDTFSALNCAEMASLIEKRE